VNHLESCFYNHNELDLRNGFFREEEVFVWALYRYTSVVHPILIELELSFFTHLASIFVG
jgi:hypothetical protein